MSTPKKIVKKPGDVNHNNAYFPTTNKAGQHPGRSPNKSLLVQNDIDGSFFIQDDTNDIYVDNTDMPMAKRIFVNDTQYFKELSLCFYSDETAVSQPKQRTQTRVENSKSEPVTTTLKNSKAPLYQIQKLSLDSKEESYVNVHNLPKLAVKRKPEAPDSGRLDSNRIQRDSRNPLAKDIRELKLYRSGTNASSSRNSSRDNSLNHSSSMGAKNLDSSRIKENNSNNNSLLYKGRAGLLKQRTDNSQFRELSSSRTHKEITKEYVPAEPIARPKNGNISKLITNKLKMYVPEKTSAGIKNGTLDKSKHNMIRDYIINGGQGPAPSRPVINSSVKNSSRNYQ